MIELGVPIIWSVHATETIQKERSWRERLFSLPWRPRKKFKTEQKPAIYLIDPNALSSLPRWAGGGKYAFIHPAFRAQLEEACSGWSPND